MARTATMAAEGSGSGLTAVPRNWWERIKGFYTDVRMEMKKVTTPAMKEVQATTTVVIIAVFIFGVYFWLVDNAIAQVIDRGLRYFSSR